MQGSMELIKIVLSGLVFWLIVRSSFKRDCEWLLVEYSGSAKALMVVMFGVSSLFIYSATQAEKGPIAVVYAVLFAIFAASFVSVLETFLCKLWFDNERIHYQSSYGRRVTINIDDIADCRVAWFGNTYQFIGTQGEKIEITPYMSGADDFYALVKRYLAEKNT